MAKVTGGTQPIDMTIWGPQSMLGGLLNSHSSTLIDFLTSTGGDGPLFQIIGTGFTYKNVSGGVQVTGGTVTEVRALADTNVVRYDISGLNMPAVDFFTLASQGTVAFETKIFSGNDTLTGTSADFDNLLGYAGNDTIHGMGGNDILDGGSGNDHVWGDDGDDTIKGSSGDDVLSGDAGNDILDGGAGTNTVSGGDGDDTFFSGLGTNVLNGGNGNDTVDYSAVKSGVNISLKITTPQAVGNYHDTLRDIENLTGTNHNDTLTGNSGDNTLTGNSGNDIFHLEDGGRDTALGGSGNDTFYFGAHYDSSDYLDGGDGTDTLIFNANYTGQIYAGGLDAISIEKFVFTGAYNYNFKLTGNNIQSTPTVDASALDAHHAITFESDRTPVIFYGGAGNDSAIVTGNQGTNGKFHLEAGGHDIATGSGWGADVFYMGGAYDAGDKIDGGSGGPVHDTLDLNGDYSTKHVIAAANIDALTLHGGHNYNLAIANSFTSHAGILLINGQSLGAAESLTLDGAAASLRLSVSGGAGNDVLTGGALNDSFQLSNGGNDTVFGGGGNDSFDFGSSLTTADNVDGGAGTNHLTLDGFGAAQIVLDSQGSIRNIQALTLKGSHDYDIAVHAGYSTSLNIDAREVHSLSFDDSATSIRTTIMVSANANIRLGSGNDTITCSAGTNVVYGGAGVDNFTAGSGNDSFYGGDGNDSFNAGFGTDILDGGAGDDQLYGHVGSVTMTGGTGHDIFGVELSRINNYATITDFNPLEDTFMVERSQPNPVTAIDPLVTHGALDSGPNMQAEMEAAIGSAQLLGLGHAVVFEPDSGNLAGKMFLIIDYNGQAGYQHDDHVVLLTGTSTIAGLTPSDFIPLPY